MNFYSSKLCHSSTRCTEETEQAVEVIVLLHAGAYNHIIGFYLMKSALKVMWQAGSGATEY